VERMLRITNHLQVLWLAIALALAILPLQ